MGEKLGPEVQSVSVRSHPGLGENNKLTGSVALVSLFTGSQSSVMWEKLVQVLKFTRCPFTSGTGR